MKYAVCQKKTSENSSKSRYCEFSCIKGIHSIFNKLKLRFNNYFLIAITISLFVLMELILLFIPLSTTAYGYIKTIGGIKFVYIKGGAFQMGSPDSDRYAPIVEKPRHKVRISSFYIGKYEVTQAQYKAIMRKNPSKNKGAKLPVENVSWYDAMKFCKKFSKKYRVKVRLPYEAEWEYAARAGTTTKYYWGDKLNSKYSWYWRNSSNKTHPVGQKRPNKWGLYDVLGNVWEWCMDWYDMKYYSKSPYKNPHGPDNGEYKVIRGGSWVEIFNCRTRGWVKPNDKVSYGGFRVVMVK